MNERTPPGCGLTLSVVFWISEPRQTTCSFVGVVAFCGSRAWGERVLRNQVLGIVGHMRISGLLPAWLAQLSAPVENVQIAMGCEEPMPLLSCGLPHEAELDHVLQSLRNSRGGERKQLGCRRYSDNWLAQKVLVDAKN